MLVRLMVGAFFAASLASGCSPKVVVPVESPSVNAITIPSESLVRLEQADKLDGKADHVIGKCYVCNLGMDGSDKHVVKVGDYTAHLCSKSCQKEFAASAEKFVMETEIPKAAAKE